MKNITVKLPDSVDLSEAEIQQLVLTSVAARQDSSIEAAATDLNILLVRLPSPAAVADVRHLIGLYYAERATQLIDELWDEKAWTADTMHEWLREHMRVGHK